MIVPQQPGRSRWQSNCTGYQGQCFALMVLITSTHDTHHCHGDCILYGSQHPNNKLTYLNMRENNLGDEGGKAIAEAIMTSK
jgi:hypothetical protein